jgi:nucleoside-diphosphate-sugar epimerase
MVNHPMVLDDSRAHTELGYRPVISVERGMAEMV